MSPFITNKSFRNGGNIILQENEEIVVDSKTVCDIFNDYFVGQPLALLTKLQMPLVPFINIKIIQVF